MYGLRKDMNMDVKRLYVGNLPFSMEAADIAAEFGVEADAVTLPVDSQTGRKKGFGFVDVPADKAAEIIESMNGKEVGGRPLTVNEARPREERSNNRGNWGDR